MRSEFLEGTKVRLKVNVERYPHFLATAGLEGVVTVSDEHLLAVRMDQPLAGAEAWDNEICWMLDEGQDPSGQLEVRA